MQPAKLKRKSPSGSATNDLVLSAYQGTNDEVFPHTLVKEGWCWWYQKYAPGDAV